MLLGAYFVRGTSKKKKQTSMFCSSKMFTYVCLYIVFILFPAFFSFLFVLKVYYRCLFEYTLNVKEKICSLDNMFY